MRPFTRWLWHGVGRPEAWDAICKGRGPSLPTKHVHDVGDWGIGVYFTTSTVRAKIYSRSVETPQGRRYPLVYARVHLSSPLLFDFSAAQIMHPEDPSTKLKDELERRFGSTLHGTAESRAEAARRWREGLLAAGHDGIVVKHSQDSEVVVYTPHRSILAYECFLRRGTG